VEQVFEEMRQAMHTAIEGITWPRLVREGAITYPCLSADDPGQPIVFHDHFPTPDGRVKLVPVDIIPANERPGCRLPHRPDHRPPARTLAHRQHDAAQRSARRAGTQPPPPRLNGVDLDAPGPGKPGDTMRVSLRGAARWC
jgi:formate dehydrogenase major subunit